MRVPAQREMHRAQRVAQQHDVLVRPAFVAHDVRLEPQRAIAQQLVGAQVLAEHFGAVAPAVVLAGRVQAGAAPAVRIHLDQEGAQVLAVLVAVGDEDAVFGLAEDQRNGGSAGACRTRRTCCGGVRRPGGNARRTACAPRCCCRRRRPPCRPRRPVSPRPLCAAGGGSARRPRGRPAPARPACRCGTCARNGCPAPGRACPDARFPCNRSARDARRTCRRTPDPPRAGRPGLCPRTPRPSHRWRLAGSARRS